MTSSGSFDPEAKEQELLAEATSWDISNPAGPEPGDIPTVDVGPYFATGANVDLQLVADTLRHACEEVGFYQLVGHQIPEPLIADTFEWSRRFHDLDLATKQKINLDNPDWPVSTVGYMPVGERRLPRRAKGNLNEAFLLKGDRGVDYGDNQWLPEQDLPGFRAAIEEYGRAVSDLALRLLPVYAVALDLDRDTILAFAVHPLSAVCSERRRRIWYRSPCRHHVLHPVAAGLAWVSDPQCATRSMDQGTSE